MRVYGCRVAAVVSAEENERAEREKIGEHPRSRFVNSSCVDSGEEAGTLTLEGVLTLTPQCTSYRYKVCVL
jgi:hypothetical protein